MEKKNVLGDAKTCLVDSLVSMNLGLDIEGEIRGYLQAFWGKKLEDSNVKDPALQEKMHGILQMMFDGGHKAEAEAIYNTHRVLTEYRGYGANEKASEDVEACFGDKFEIPEQGAIVVDTFVTRNLPAIVKICERRGIDLKRIKVRCPKIVLAAQLMRMDDAKKTEMEEVFAKLDESQFLTDSNGSPHDINLPEGEQIAVHFTPRTLPYRFEWHVDGNEMDTARLYMDWVRGEVARVVPGGRVFMNITTVPDFEKLESRMDTSGKRPLVKPVQQITDKVVKAIMTTLRGLGVEVLDGEKFGPIEGYDHKKVVQGLHVRKNNNS